MVCAAVPLRAESSQSELYDIERRVEIHIQYAVSRLEKLALGGEAVGKVVCLLGHAGVGDNDVDMPNCREDAEKGRP